MNRLSASTMPHIENMKTDSPPKNRAFAASSRM